MVDSAGVRSQTRGVRVSRFLYTVPTKLLGTPPFFQCILMALRVSEKVQILPERLGLDFFFLKYLIRI
jgi:hypothetical protein